MLRKACSLHCSIQERQFPSSSPTASLSLMESLYAVLIVPAFCVAQAGLKLSELLLPPKSWD